MYMYTVDDATIVDEEKSQDYSSTINSYLNLKLMLTMQTVANECYRERAK